MRFRIILCVSLIVLATVGANSRVAASDSVIITIGGTIEPKCGKTSIVNVFTVPDPSQAGSDIIRFEIDCNAPFRYSLISRNGGLRLNKAGAVPSAFSNKLPYRVSVHIPLETGLSIRDMCASTHLREGAVSCRFSDSGNAIAIRKTGEIHMAWDKSAKPLMAGIYEDTLTVLLAVRI